MKQLDGSKSTPLEDAKLERLATLLGEFLARTWMKKTKNEKIHSKCLSGKLSNLSNRHGDSRNNNPQ